ncbi:MAG TPA: hypothetical protein VFH49_15370 [Aquabacterium sp.]|nr:hypothetical protein [Aquabacterium sp.]
MPTHTGYGHAVVDAVLKVAVTALLPFIVSVHAPVPVQAPLQPAKTPPLLAAAVKVTVPPLANAALHVPPQLMPAGLLVIVPVEGAEPFLVTVTVYVVAAAPATANGNTPDTLPPGLSTEILAVPAAAMSVAGIAALT